MELDAVSRASAHIIRSQEEEIKRTALELHEGIAQNLYSLFTGIAFIQSEMKQPHLQSYTEGIADLVKRTIQEIQQLSVELYPPTLQTLGLVAALKSYCKLFTATFGIVITLKSEGKEFSLPEEQRMAVFKVCQKALMNIAQYADATEAYLFFTWSEKSLKIEIEDNGKGFNGQEAMNTDHFCELAGMEQRMMMVGGACRLLPAEGKGTKFSVVLPVQK